MCSVTDAILPGSVDNPAFTTIINPPQTPYFQDKIKTLPFNGWRISLWIPVVSTVTGFCLALVGIIHSIIHLTGAIFDSDNRHHHWREFNRGIWNVPYGIVAMLPILGNIAICIKDYQDVAKYDKKAQKYIAKYPEECKNSVILLYDGHKVAAKAFWRLKELIHQKNASFSYKYRISPFQAMIDFILL